MKTPHRQSLRRFFATRFGLPMTDSELDEIERAVLRSNDEDTVNDSMKTPHDTTTTTGKIAVMQAHERGENIEFKVVHRDGTPGVFCPITDGKLPSWNWDRFDYRVKPTPREVFVVFGPEGIIHSVAINPVVLIGRDVVLFREVLP